MNRRQCLGVTVVLLLSCSMGVHGWATLKKILIARLLSGPRVIAVPVPIPSGHQHHPPPLPPHHHPHPPPPPPMMPVPIPVHHYHYPPTNIWQSPLPKPAPDVITDLSHLHALYDSASLHAPHKQNYQYDVIDLGTASDVLTADAGTKSTKTTPKNHWPTYREPVATRRPSYTSQKSHTYSTAQQEAYMAALKEYLKQQYTSQTETSWPKPSLSYHNAPSKWAFAEDATSKTKEYSRVPITSYGWQYPDSFGYKDTMASLAAKQPSSRDNYDWARYMASMNTKSSSSSGYDWTKHMTPAKEFSLSDNYDWASHVASAYKSAAEKALKQTSAVSRYDTAQQDSESYSSAPSTPISTTESASASESYESSEGAEASSSLPSTTSSTASSTSTTSIKNLEAPNPPPATSNLPIAESGVKKDRITRDW
ncbi:putative serine-rich protein C215.13-like [Ixodes scapularis]